jgi:CheY-like chemotaxis protein
MISKKKYDIIFMDLIMPKMDGFETCKKIRDLGNNEATNLLAWKLDDYYHSRW